MVVGVQEGEVNIRGVRGRRRESDLVKYLDVTSGTAGTLHSYFTIF